MNISRDGPSYYSLRDIFVILNLDHVSKLQHVSRFKHILPTSHLLTTTQCHRTKNICSVSEDGSSFRFDFAQEGSRLLQNIRIFLALNTMLNPLDGAFNTDHYEK